jgi:hypothetical protein
VEVSFVSEIKGIGRFPSGKNLGSGIMTNYPYNKVDQSNHGSLMTAEGNDRFVWRAHEKGKVIEGGKVKGLIIVTGFTNSQKKLSWMNNLIMALESEFDPESKKFKITAYEWE